MKEKKYRLILFESPPKRVVLEVDEFVDREHTRPVVRGVYGGDLNICFSLSRGGVATVWCDRKNLEELSRKISRFIRGKV